MEVKRTGWTVIVAAAAVAVAATTIPLSRGSGNADDLPGSIVLQDTLPVLRPAAAGGGDGLGFRIVEPPIVTGAPEVSPLGQEPAIIGTSPTRALPHDDGDGISGDAFSDGGDADDGVGDDADTRIATSDRPSSPTIDDDVDALASPQDPIDDPDLATVDSPDVPDTPG
jgi:hypothetical protein